MIGYEPSGTEAIARRLFGIGPEPEEERAAALGLDAAAYAALRTAAEDFAAWHGRFDERAIRYAEDQLLAAQRAFERLDEAARQIRATTAAWATPARSRMHTAYRAKTRRRNRR